MPHKRPSRNTTRKRNHAWAEAHLSIIVIVGCTLAGLLARYSFREFCSEDMTYWLLPWFDAISANGLNEQIGDYNFLYQFLIWIMTKINMSPIYSYKLLSTIFDFLLAVVGARIVYSTVKENTRIGNIEKWAITYCAIWLSPIVILNSTCWGQCDSMYTSFLLLSVLLLLTERYTPAMLVLGVSFAFKLQTVFILPLFIYVYFVKRRFSIFKFLFILVAFFGLSLPLVLWGRSPIEAIGVYVNQTGSYPMMSLNYPSFWCFFYADKDAEAYVYMKYPAIAITALILILLMLWWKKKFPSTDSTNLLALGFLIVFTCVLFLPSMHERYGYSYEVLAIILVFIIPKTLPLCLGLIAISLNTYSSFLFGASANYLLLACLNCGIYLSYILIASKELTKLGVLQ